MAGLSLPSPEPLWPVALLCHRPPTRRFFGCRRDQEVLCKYLRRNSAQRQHQANRRGQRQRGLLEANSAGHGAITQRNSARFRFRRALSLAGSRRPAGLQASPRRAAAEGLSCLLSWLEPCPGGIIWGRVRVPSPRRKVDARAFPQSVSRHSALHCNSLGPRTSLHSLPPLGESGLDRG